MYIYIYIHIYTGREGTLFSLLQLYYASPTSVRFENRASWISCDHLCNIYIHRQVLEGTT